MLDLVAQIHAFLSENPRALDCFERGAPFVGDPLGPGFRTAFAAAARKLRAEPAPRPPPALLELGRPHFTFVDWTRAGLLGAALERAVNSQREPVVRGLFERGEIGEQESLLRTLALLPGAESYVEVALLGVRTNARRVLEAIACENVYPTKFFGDPSFNQMVLKALFTEVPVKRIEGLSRRHSPELVRMVEAYRSERLAAGRSVPEDVDFLLGGAGS